MLSFRRQLSAKLRLRNPAQDSLRKIYSSLLTDPCFRNFNLNESLSNELQPYDLSASILGKLSKMNATQLVRESIHNRTIEALTKHDFSIGTIHARELLKMGGQLSLGSFVQIVNNNPGRVQSSWEIFMQYYPLVNTSPEALLAVLRKLIYFDPVDIKDDKKELDTRDLARCAFLMKLISRAGCLERVPDLYWSIILKASIENKASMLIPLIIKHHMPSYSTFDEAQELTNYQVYQLFHNGGKRLANENLPLFKRVLTVLGYNSCIKLTSEETDVRKELEKELENISKQLHTRSPIFFPDEDVSSCPAFENNLQAVLELDKGKISKSGVYEIALRSLGIYKGDLPNATNYFRKFAEDVPSEVDNMQYELFLGFIHRSVQIRDRELLQEALHLVPQSSSNSMKLSVDRALIVAFSIFDIEKALAHYNCSISNLGKSPLEGNSNSEAGLLTEALILAYLGRKDRDFAHVILEGAAGEGLFPGPYAIKKVKKTFAAFGDILDQDNVDVRLQTMVLDYIKGL
ncbi:LAQU0S05e00122g1_1 [Lachancea quebecensis]|uniref:LAQU0S05e00122g1_1 n=1 Tax=Lachancea quebecensis TaxID=1654605 RepID=A0A0P1KT34_9SACH|nr:LAQU0S05e00122g1_1 [Lachancea quebecensis]